MESFIEFIKSDLFIFYAKFFVIIIVIFYVLIKLFTWKSKDNKLNHDFDDRDEDESDEPEEENPKGRFFVIESYYLPDDWEETFDVIVDRQTKVQYLNYGAYGITPLIDSNGKPILYRDKHKEQGESE